MNIETYDGQYISKTRLCYTALYSIIQHYIACCYIPYFCLCVTCLLSCLLPIMCTISPFLPSTGLSRTYPLSRYLAAMSHYAMSLTPSYSIQTFSRVRFILSHLLLMTPFLVLLTHHS